MHAAFYEETGEAQRVLKLGELSERDPGPGEVRVRIAVSGINPSDVKNRAGWNGMKMGAPRIVPNQDGAGVIDRVGSGVDPSRLRERVWVFEALLTSGEFGTAAEFVVVPASRAIPLPIAVDYAHGATLGVPALTAHRCVFADGPVTGQTILVAGGAGAVGRAAVQLARWGGARVIATAGAPGQVATAKAAGAHAAVSYHHDDCEEQLSALAPNGFDRIIEVALPKNIQMDSRLVRAGGTIMTFASGADDVLVPSRLLLVKAVTLRWVHVYSMPEAAKAAATADISAALAAGAMTMPPSVTFPLEQIAEAHDAVGIGGAGRKVLLDIATV